MGVVLDLPEPLIEAFSLVGLSVLVLALIIGKQVLGSQEGPGGKNHRPVPGEPGHPGKEASLWVKTWRGHLRFMCSKEEDGILVGWGLHGTISNVINL